MEKYPFFALLLMYVKFVSVSDMKKMSTNGRCIYFSPDFLDRLYDYELDYILCHQIVHLVYGHIFRPLDYSGDDYHFACDIQANAFLSELGFCIERHPHLGNLYDEIPGVDLDPKELSPVQIHSLVPYSLYAMDERSRDRFLPDNDIWWDQKEDNGRCGDIVLDLPELDGMLKEENGADILVVSQDGNGGLQQLWQMRTATAMATTGKDGQADAVSELVKRILAKMTTPKMDWKKILNHFVQEQVCDYSFSPPDRRFSDSEFFLPDFNEKDFVAGEILFMVDTSGSVRDEDLAAVYSELKSAVEQFNGTLKGELGFFDTEVVPPLPFENVNDLMKIIPYGGGGTEFGVIFDYLRNNGKAHLPHCIVIFTDGYGPYPDEKETMGIPVLWIINNEEITPPWGKVTRLLPE